MHPRNVGHSGSVRKRRRDKQWGVRRLSKRLLYLELVAGTPMGPVELFSDSSAAPWFCDEARTLWRAPWQCRSGVSRGFHRPGASVWHSQGNGDTQDICLSLSITA